MVFLISALAFGQGYEAKPCVERAGVAVELKMGRLADLAPVGPDYLMTAASSILAPSPKKRPPKPDDTVDDYDVYAEQLIAWDRWTCTYGPTALVDGKVETAWSEGAPGLGIGHAVVVPLPPGELEIRAGYAKSAQRWAENGRPTKVEVMVLAGGWMPPTQGAYALDLQVMGRHEVVLKDEDAWQPLPLPPTQPVVVPDKTPTGFDYPEQTPTYLAIRIVEAVKGTRWEDVLISEIRTKP